MRWGTTLFWLMGYTEHHTHWQHRDNLVHPKIVYILYKWSPIKESKQAYFLCIADACSAVTCASGRQCKVTGQGHAECVCGDVDLCQGHSKVVCGSDGRLYPSFCEMHRTACTEQRHIRANQHSLDCHWPAVDQSGEIHTLKPWKSTIVMILNLIWCATMRYFVCVLQFACHYNSLEVLTE